MAERRSTPADALREAVERTVQATARLRERSAVATQGAVDDLVDTVRRAPRRASPRGAARDRGPAPGDPGGREASSRPSCASIGRRLDAIEERLPAKRCSRLGRPPQSRPAKSVAGRRVLITGVGSYSARCSPPARARPGVRARRRARHRACRARALERTRVHRGRHPRPGDRDADPAAEVDTVVHNQIVRRPGPGMSRRAMHDINVIGSLQLLAACEQAATDPHDRDPRAPPASTAPSRTPRSSSARRWRGCSRCAPASSATSARSRTTSRPTRAATRG